MLLIYIEGADEHFRDDLLAIALVHAFEIYFLLS